MRTILPILALLLVFSCTTKNVTQFSKIEYDAGACYGSCPVFKLQINGDRSAIIQADRFTFSKGKLTSNDLDKREGTFTGTIKEQDYAQLISLINKLNIEDLKSDYGNRNVSDLPTSYLTIHLPDGSTKKIKDYGKNGTQALKEVYTFLENLRTTQSWKKIN